MNRLLPTLSLLVVLGVSSTAVAHDPDGSPPRHARRDLRELAAQIAGGASLLYDVVSNRPAEEFRDRAHHFQESLGGGRGHVTDDWRELRSSFEGVRRSTRRDERRIDFLVSHLQEDIAEADGLVRSYAFGAPPPPSGEPHGSEGRISFIDHETCVGTRPSGTPCTPPRDSLTFRIPRDVGGISRLDAEWRDFGRGANAEVYVNDRLVWRSDVAKDWDGDGTTLDVRIPPGSTLTVRSSNGDPIWIRRLTAETVATAGRERTYRNPWEFIWQDPYR
jgi:hypothetical protein